MNEDEQRALLKSAQQVQNIQLKLTLGLIAGAIVGLIFGAWVVMPFFADNFWPGILGAFASIIAGAFIGQRLVLNTLAGR